MVAGRHCVAVNSGTSALQLTLDGPGLRPGRRGHRALVLVRRHRQRRPPGRRRAGLRRHRAGQLLPRPGRRRRRDQARAPSPSCRCTSTATPPRWTGCMALAERHGLAVVEDACQAHGAALHGQPVGAFGVAGCFSFYPTKNMHSLEGGMITTADRRAGPHPAAAAQPGHGAAIRERDRRREHAADRRRGGDRPGAAHPAARVDRAAPGQRQVPRLPDHQRRHAAGRRRRPARLPPVHGAGARRPRRRPARAGRARASAARSTTPRRSTGSSPTSTTAV